MNTIEVTAKSIVLEVGDPNDWPIAERLVGSAKSEYQGRYEYTRSALNLQRIFSVFSGPKKPVLKGSAFFMDQEREKFSNYVKSTHRTLDIIQSDRMPVQPNGKFVPYAHQTKIVGLIDVNPYAAICCDCGIGKTGAAARAAELALERGDVVKGKILVSAPLSILGTSWMDDIKKFTNLKACLLKVKVSNKDILGGEEIILKDFGPKPADAVAVKKRKKTLYRNEAGDVVSVMDTLTKAMGPWKTFRATVSVAINLNGEETPFGKVTGRTVAKEETKKIKIKELLDDPMYDIYLINHDGVKTYQDLLKEHQFAWVIVDESTKIKSPSSKVFSAHVDISWKCKRRNILTGTPNPNGFIDLWAQFYFLDRGLTLEGSMKDFLGEYFTAIKIGHFAGKDANEWVIRSKEDRDRLIARVKRAGIFLKQRDCIDLPPRTDLRREVAMTSEQERAYLEMENELITEFMDANTSQLIRAEAVNVLSKIMKLRQITSGFMAGSGGELGAFKDSPKLEDLDGFIEELGDNKLVVACQFREEIRTLLERYKKLGITSIDGSVNTEARDQRVRDFQTTDKYKIVVLQPQAAAHGLTFTASNYLLFLSLDYNFEYYYQTAKRIERLGQKNNIFIVHSLATLGDGSQTIDHDLLAVLAEKNKDRDILFNEAQDLPDLASALADRLIKRGKSRL